MEIRWPLPAAEDLLRICEWVKRDNSEAARRVAKVIYDGCAQLGNFPNIGRTSRSMSGRRMSNGRQPSPLQAFLKAERSDNSRTTITEHPGNDVPVRTLKSILKSDGIGE